jgi:hypothetical protein
VHVAPSVCGLCFTYVVACAPGISFLSPAAHPSCHMLQVSVSPWV